ncbi:MAG: hypothetical protein RL538_459 [Candidatus Parcubacteria bacterium]|jgi:hypothetical protein
MNTVTTEKKSTQKKLLIATAFIVIIILIAWLSVQIVRYTPNAFSSLASLAQGIDQYRKTLDGNVDGPLVITSDVASTTIGSPVTLNWNRDNRTGRYAFSHACKDGLSVDIVDTDGLRAISCETVYDLGDTNTLTFIINSDTQASASLPYLVSFMRTNDTNPIRVGEGAVTVETNTTVAANTDDGTVLGESDSQTSKEEPEPVPTAPVVTTPTYKPTYTLPVSNPNGFVDLKATYRAVGAINGNVFKTASLTRNDDGALQFEIENVGTKISGRWTYSVTLPDSDTYISPLQAPLMPTERVIISIGFPVEDTSSHAFVVTVAETNDIKLSNNTFKQVTKILK